MIADQLEKGIVEVVKESGKEGSGKNHYVHHHAVVRRDKETTRLRIVYNASEQSNGPSLNDSLYAGPSYG